eukprot:2209816-Rhodomonas_salina.1
MNWLGWCVGCREMQPALCDADSGLAVRGSADAGCGASALDAESEHAVQTAIDNLISGVWSRAARFALRWLALRPGMVLAGGGATVVLVAHRLSTVCAPDPDPHFLRQHNHQLSWRIVVFSTSQSPPFSPLIHFSTPPPSPTLLLFLLII